MVWLWLCWAARWRRTSRPNSSKPRDTETQFDNLLKDACDLLEGQEDEDDEIQVRRVRLLGNTEHIFCG